MRRGEVWTASGGADYTGKPRPVVIIQDDRFDGTASITVCPFTTAPTDAPLFRPVIGPDPANGLQAISRHMADKVTTIPKAKLGVRIGRLAAEKTKQLDQVLLVFLRSYK